MKTRAMMKKRTRKLIEMTMRMRMMRMMTLTQKTLMMMKDKS
jgi:hypothetical protein